MKLLKKKTRKAVVKQARKLMKRYGPEAAIGLVTGMVGGLIGDAAKRVTPQIALATTKGDDKPRRAKGEKKGKKAARKEREELAERAAGA